MKQTQLTQVRNSTLFIEVNSCIATVFLFKKGAEGIHKTIHSGSDIFRLNFYAPTHYKDIDDIGQTHPPKYQHAPTVTSLRR